MKKENLKNRIKVGDEVIYFDGRNQLDVEKVESIISTDNGKVAVLTNNARVNRYPDSKGKLIKVNPDGTKMKTDKGFVSIATPELLKLRKAVLSKRLCSSYLNTLNKNILTPLDNKPWEYWTEADKDLIIEVSEKLKEIVEE